MPGRFAGASHREWEQALDEAAQAGLISPLGSALYIIQAALPDYLAAEWRAADPDAYGRERQAGEQALRSAYADYSRWILAQIAAGGASAYTMVELHQQALGVMLGHALARHAWDDAEAILRALDAYRAKRGLTVEPDAWAGRALAAIADGGQAPPETANDLWLLTASLQANRRLTAGLPDEAERTYLQTIAHLQGQPESEELRRACPSAITSLACWPRAGKGWTSRTSGTASRLPSSRSSATEPAWPARTRS